MTRAEMQAERVEVDERPEWLRHDEWPFEVRFVEFDGHRVHYIDEGTGRSCSSSMPGCGPSSGVI